MITKLSLENYKAFDDASIKIRPITILLGANSVGKSSIIQLFLMMQQTGKAGLSSYKSALKLYGGYVNLGTPINLFRKKDSSKPLKLTFEVENSVLSDFLKTEYFESFKSLFRLLPMYFPIKGFSELKADEITNKNQFSKYIDTIAEVLTKSSTKDKYKNEIGWFLRRKHEIYIPDLTIINKREFVEAFDYLSELSKKITTDKFKITYNIKLNKTNNLEVNSFSITQNKLVIIEIEFNENGCTALSDIVNLIAVNEKEIQKLYHPENTLFNSFSVINNENESELSLKSSFIIQIINIFQNELRKEFTEEKINYVSPLRAHPKRYYMLDKAKLNLTLDTLDGDAVAEVLKDNKSITQDVNEWLKRFGVEVNVKEFKEVIHHLIVKQNNIDLDITDVGFGISQILPVIIQGFLSPKASTTIIEQPEIHLHPKMQADLADLFIDIVQKSDNKKLIIETHSEYLLKRLRRRISEGTISPDDVSICLFSPQTKECGATIHNLEISKKGFFEWPVEFYGGEILKDTTEFLKNQNK